MSARQSNLRVRVEEGFLWDVKCQVGGVEEDEVVVVVVVAGVSLRSFLNAILPMSFFPFLDCKFCFDA